MANVETTSLISRVSGSPCKTDGIYFRTNSVTGKVSAVKYHKHDAAEPTDDQKAVRATFTTRAKAVIAWMRANHPTESNPKGTDEYQLARKMLKSQNKVGSITGIVWKCCADDGTITIGSYVTDASAGAGGAGGTGGPVVEG